MFDFLPKYIETTTSDDGVFYICQLGNSGYAVAAKGYIYDLIQKNIKIKYQTYSFDDSYDKTLTQFDKYITSNNNKHLKKFKTVIVHSTPNIWDVLLKQNWTVTSRAQIIGRTVWEFEKVPRQWVDFINNSMVHVVSVPTQWNKDIFEKNGVTKPIVVEPHIDVRFPYTKVDLITLIKTKSEVIYNGDFSTIDLNSAYKLYTIGQFISRKGITETIDAYCKSFHKKDNVILFVKTFGRNYSVEEQNECKRKIQNIVGDLNIPPIVFLKDLLTYDEIQSLHEQCDCYIQLTRTEGFGLGIFEAYNRNKKVIVTNYGGHTEYLPKSYEGLVEYEKIPVTESLYYMVDLDSTYEWAKPSVFHAKKLLSVISKSKKDIYVSGDIFNLEYVCEKYPHRWFGKDFTFMFPNPIKRFTIYYSLINDKSNIVINDINYINIPKSGFVDTHFISPVKEVNCTCPTFTPSSLHNSNDSRELGIFIHSIKYFDVNNDEFFCNIEEVRLLEENYKLFYNSNIDIDTTDTIKYIGQSGLSGYASAAKGYIADYVLKGRHISWKPLIFDDSKNDDLYYVDVLSESVINRQINKIDTLIIHSTPDIWHEFINIKAKNIIGYCTWETNKLPHKWVEYINKISNVWVPSNFNKECFINSGVKSSIDVVPHVWHYQKLYPKNKIKIYDFENKLIPESKYTFYTIGEFNYRKGIEDLISIFDKFNNKYKDAQLILKLHYKTYDNQQKLYCIDKIKKLTNKLGTSIFLVLDSLNRDQVIALHSFGDCYVSLNKGEGFGLTIFDAYNFGKKIITTGYGGHVEYLGTDYDGLVNYKIDKVRGMDKFSTYYSSDQEWAYPDLEHAYDLMKKYYENQI